ncbi:unnamed protein product [Jaminaea pallidilutea]
MLIERTPPRRQATSPSRTPASQIHPLSAAKASTSKSSSSSKPIAQSYTWEPLESLGSSRREHGERFMTSTNSAAGATGANTVSASLPRPSPSRPGAQYDTAANRAAKGGRDIMLMAGSGHSGRNSGPRNSLNNLNSMRDTAGDETPRAVKEAKNAKALERKPAENPPAQMVPDQIPTTQASQVSRSPAGSNNPHPQAAANGTAADSNQSTPRASRPKPPASAERPLPTLAAKADTVSGNATAGSSSSASAANDEFERKLLAAMAQAEAGVNPFLDARKAEMRGESMAAAAKQASRMMDERRKSAVEAVVEQSDAIVQDVEVAEEGHDAAAEEEEEEEVTVTDVVTDDATTSSKIAQTTSSHAPSTGQRTEDLVLIEQSPSMRTDVEDVEEADAPESVPIGGTEGAHATASEPLQQRTHQQTQKADTVAIELQTLKDENARWQSLVAELKADLEAARKAPSPAAGPLEVATTSAPVNEDAAAVRGKYEALKTSYLELKVAKDEVVMQQLEAMEATSGAQLEICALRFQLAVERGRREAVEVAAAAAVKPSQLASPMATKTVLPDKSSALEATAKSVPKSTAAAPAGSSKGSVASIAARRPAKANSQMASDVMPPSSAAAATDEEESHLASAVEDVFDDEDELDAPMSPARLEPVKTGKASAATSRAAASKPEPTSKRTMVAPQPRKRPVYANLDDEEDVAEPHGASSDIDEEVDPLPTKKHKSSSHEVATKSKSGSASSTAAKRTTTMDSTAAAAPAKAVVSKTSNLAKPVAGASKTANSSTTTTTTKKSEPAPAPAPAKAPAKQPAPTTKTTSRASAPSKAARRMTFDRAELKQVGHGSDSDSDDDMQAVDDNDDDEGDETAFVLPTKKKSNKEAAAPVSVSSKTAKAASAAATSKPAPTAAAAAAPAIKKKRRLLGPSKMPFDASSQRGDGGGDRGGSRGLAIDDGSESENLLNPALEIPLILSPVKGFGGVGGGVPAAGGQAKKGKFGLGANANRFGGGGRGMFG